MATLSKVVREELIGRAIKIIVADNKANVGITGKIIDETKHLLVLETKKGIKRVPKKGNVFQITHLGEKVEIKGELLFGSPDERIKTKV